MGPGVDGSKEVLWIFLGVIWWGSYIRKHPYFLEIPAEVSRGNMS